MVKYRDILNRYMYRDEFEIWRRVGISDGDVDDFTLAKICAGVGHLADYGKTLTAHRDDRTQHLQDDLRLDCDIDVDIQANDFVRVKHCGQTFELIAGEPFKYATHQQISCRRRKEAGQ